MSTIEFNVLIPAPPGEIHAYNTTPTAAPVDFINEKLTASNLPAMKLEATIHAARTAGAAGAPDEVHAVVNQTTGEAHLVPSLAKLVTAGIPLSQHNRHLPAAHAAGQSALGDSRFVAKDVTTLHAADGIQLLGAETGGPANA